MSAARWADDGPAAKTGTQSQRNGPGSHWLPGPFCISAAVSGCFPVALQLGCHERPRLHLHQGGCNQACFLQAVEFPRGGQDPGFQRSHHGVVPVHVFSEDPSLVTFSPSVPIRSYSCRASSKSSRALSVRTSWRHVNATDFSTASRVLGEARTTLRDNAWSRSPASAVSAAARMDSAGMKQTTSSGEFPGISQYFLVPSASTCALRALACAARRACLLRPSFADCGPAGTRRGSTEPSSCASR